MGLCFIVEYVSQNMSYKKMLFYNVYLIIKFIIIILVYLKEGKEKGGGERGKREREEKESGERERRYNRGREVRGILIIRNKELIKLLTQHSYSIQINQ